MTLQQLNYIITISEIGSINRAAEKLYVSQPSLTSAIKELEKELGIVLFNRTARGVTLTAEGADFLPYARQVYGEYLNLLEKYGKAGERKQRFGVSCQHYSFAVKAFVEMVKAYDVAKYEFAIRETKTLAVIGDVASLRSEVGILYLSDYNRKALLELFRNKGLVFHHLINCNAYVYLWKGHPLAGRESISFDDLAPYPCLSFEQGDESSFYFAEEILSTSEYPKTIKATDRATMLNLMIGLNGYTLCSGVISEELNGSDYLAVPFEPDDDTVAGNMVIGYISKKNLLLSHIAELYVKELEQYLCSYQESHK
jgi:DNA-binding transcriptional LysR family regulator